MSTFYERFSDRRAKLKSLLCVGLDPDPSKLPSGYANNYTGWLEFFTDISDATGDLAVAFKPNLGFFEALPEGDKLLTDTVSILQEKAPGALILADAKRGDIGNTAGAYARAFFERADFDAITVSPYMGLESLEPFYAYSDKATIVLCLTSNPGASEFQLSGEPALYEKVAASVQSLHRETGNLWMVAGATRSSEHLQKIRSLAPTVPLLIPGIGAQGGDLETVLQVTGQDVLINATRSIIYGARNRTDVPHSARTAALELVEKMRNFIG